MSRYVGILGAAFGFGLAIASWTVASEYAPAVTAFLIWME